MLNLKRKSLFSLLLITVPLSISMAEPQFFAVKGNVKSYTRTDYVISQKFGDYFRTPDVSYTYNLDDKGREAECLEANANGILVSKTTNTYNEKGLLASTVCTDASGVAEWKKVYTYDASGVLVDESEFNKNDVLTARTIKKYSDDKTVLEDSSYNAEGELIWRNIHKFDPATKRTIEISEYFADGTLDQKQTYIYSDAGQLTEIDYSDRTGAVVKKTLFRFNEKGQNTESATYNFTTGSEERELYRFDDAGNNIVRVTTYNVAHKFDSIVNELVGMSEFKYSATAATTPKAPTKK